MAKPPSKQIAWLANVMAARMLADAAGPGRALQLEEALRAWLPDADSRTLAEAATEAQSYLRGVAAAVDARLQTWITTGRAEPLPGCDGRV